MYSETFHIDNEAFADMEFSLEELMPKEEAVVETVQIVRVVGPPKVVVPDIETQEEEFVVVNGVSVTVPKISAIV